MCFFTKQFIFIKLIVIKQYIYISYFIKIFGKIIFVVLHYINVYWICFVYYCIVDFTFNIINYLKVVNVSILLWFIQIKKKILELNYNI